MGTARISLDVERYGLTGPLPYSSQPVERDRRVTYRTFFEAPAGDAPAHDRPEEPRRYRPGPVANWQAQHPPLYYLVASPVYRATRHLSWGGHLLCLRLLSYLLPWCAWALALYGCFAAMSSVPPTEGEFPWPWAALGIAVWPMLLPAWFPEFARLGNDSLSALIATGLWLLSVASVRTGLSTRRALALGALLGAGALTKAHFVAIAAGMAGFWLLRAWSSRGREAVVPAAARVMLMLGVMAALAGWWYARNRHPYLVPLWPAEIAALREAGGLTGGLARNLTLAAWLRGQAAMVTTVAWSGTWSLARPPHVFLAPLALLVVLTGAAYVSALRRFRPADLAWLPAWMAAPVAAGLSYHALVRIAQMGEAITPGYYFHMLFAPLGCALGLALRHCWGRAACRRVLTGLSVYALAFAAAVSWAQVLMFTGHLFRSEPNKFYHAASPLSALLDVPEVLDRLGRLAFPAIGAIAFVVGTVLVLTGAVSAWRLARQSVSEPSRT